MTDKTNKISIYLLKQQVKLSDFFKKEFMSVELANGTFYYDASHSNPPSWLKNFFGNNLEVDALFSSSSKGVYVTSVEFEKVTHTFAIPFGYGHSMFDKTFCVDDFGLKLIINLVDRNTIRKIGKRTLSSDPKNTIEQLSKIGSISDFGLDIEQDLVEEITGKPKSSLKEIFGENLVTGKVAFTVSVKLDVNDIEGFLRDCKEYYEKTDYKEHFEFIDQVKEIKSTERLIERLVEKLQGRDDEYVQVWLAVPEIIEWEDVQGFSFKGKKRELHPDISLKDFLDNISEEELAELDIQSLKRRKVTAYRITTDDEYASWGIYQCMYCEISDTDRTVILTNGKWYEIAKDFVKIVNKNYSELMEASTEIKLPPANANEHENKYNDRLAKSINNSVLMDAENIRYGGGSSSIEFCDVYDADNKRFIHVKNYYGSSALSHLFAQGRVSGQLFLNDKPFRKKVKEKVKEIKSDIPIDIENNPTASDFQIVFGVISESSNELNLPFFSKVNLKNEKKLLETFGFKNIYLTKIQRVQE